LKVLSFVELKIPNDLEPTLENLETIEYIGIVPVIDEDCVLFLKYIISNYT
jgi:myosin heavy subunit